MCALAVGTGRARPEGASLTLTLEDTPGGTLAVVLANGATLTPGSPSAATSPGPYQVVFSDQVPDTTDTVHMFQLTGPGVDLQTDMDGGDDKSELFTATLAPSSVYTFQDTAQPSLGDIVFGTSSTAASGSNTAGGGGSSSGAAPPTNGHSSTSGSVSANQSITATPSSAARLLYRGTLRATVSKSGRLALSYRGRNVSSLSAGRYTVVVDDLSATSGFILQELTHPPTALTGASFIGVRSASVDLTAGQWFFYPGLLGRKSYFIVVK